MSAPTAIFSSVQRLVALMLVASCALVDASPRAPRGPVSRRALKPVDIIQAARTVALRMAPDGSKVLYEVSRANVAANTRTCELWVVDARLGTPPVHLTSRTHVRVAPLAFDAQWVPDLRAVSYLVDRPGGGGVMLHPLARLAGRRKAAAGPSMLVSSARFPVGSSIVGHQWSPDGQTMALIVSAPMTPPTAPPKGKQGSAGATDVDDLRWPLPPPTQAQRVWLFSRATRQLVPLTPPTLDVEGVSWSPDSRRLVATASPAGNAYPMLTSDLFILNVNDRSVTPLVQQPGWDREPVWSHDGQRIAFVTQQGRYDWSYVSVIGIVPATGGVPTYVGQTMDETVGSVVAQPWWSADDSSIFVTASYQMGRHLFSIDVASGKFTARTSGDAYHDPISPSSDGRRLALGVSLVNRPTEIYVADAADMQLRVVARPNPNWGRGMAMPRLQTIDWPSGDGRFSVHGALVLPADYEPGQQCPLIVFTAGGPSMIRLGFNLDEDVFPHLALAARGYIVFAPNTRGRRGYGASFRRAPVDAGHVFEAPYDDMMRGLEALRNAGIWLGEQAGLAGFSYGGSLAAFAMTRTNRFKAAVVQEGFPNYLRMVVSMSGRGEDLQGLHDQLGLTDVWQPGSLQRLIEHSPILAMDRTTTPTLLLYGEDGAAKLDGIDWLRALRQFHVPARLRVYPRTAHVIYEPALLMDSFEQSIGWFDRWLKPTSASHPVQTPTLR